MKKTITLLLILLFSYNSIAFAKSNANAIGKAMKSYEKREYRQALRLFQPALNSSAINSLDKDKAAVGKLSMGIVLLENAKLHKKLYETALPSSISYLKQLLKKKKGQKTSQYANLFLAEAYLEKKEYKNAAKFFNIFLKTKNIEKNMKHAANAGLGLSQYKLNQKSKAKNTWKKLKSQTLIEKSSLSTAKYKAGLKTAKKEEIIQMYNDFLKLEDQGKPVSAQLISNMLYLTMKEKMYDEALTIALSENIDNDSFREKFPDDKIIAFYNISLLKNLYETYDGISKSHFTDVSTDSKYGSTAAFYLLTSAIVFDDKTARSASNTKLGTNARIPGKLKKLLPIRLAANDYLNGNKKQAMTSWNSVMSKNASNPDIVADIINMCSRTNANCDEIVSKAQRLSKAGLGRKFKLLNTALGGYLLRKGKSVDALSHFELARDKSNKNKISSNDPLLLVSLAEGYRLEKTFNESLEIYFQMSRHFPVIRQIQEAVQGTYSMQQKSAGDVKIF